MDRKNDEIGIMDNLKWSSAAKVLTVVTDDEFYDGNLLRRLEILHKYLLKMSNSKSSNFNFGC